MTALVLVNADVYVYMQGVEVFFCMKILYLISSDLTSYWPPHSRTYKICFLLLMHCFEHAHMYTLGNYLKFL